MEDLHDYISNYRNSNYTILIYIKVSSEDDGRWDHFCMALCRLWIDRNGARAGPLLDPKLTTRPGIERCERRRWAARTAARPNLCDLLLIMIYPGKLLEYLGMSNAC